MIIRMFMSVLTGLVIYIKRDAILKYLNLTFTTIKDVIMFDLECIEKDHKLNAVLDIILGFITCVFLLILLAIWIAIYPFYYVFDKLNEFVEGY
jgi:hypothetical protein|nr:MAG TPA: hypothetical protein [Caudoviricetes sp.]